LQRRRPRRRPAPLDLRQSGAPHSGGAAGLRGVPGVSAMGRSIDTVKDVYAALGQGAWLGAIHAGVRRWPDPLTAQPNLPVM
jgi:hypothetical protein